MTIISDSYLRLLNKINNPIVTATPKIVTTQAAPQPVNTQTTTQTMVSPSTPVYSDLTTPVISSGGSSGGAVVIPSGTDYTSLFQSAAGQTIPSNSLVDSQNTPPNTQVNDNTTPLFYGSLALIAFLLFKRKRN